MVEEPPVETVSNIRIQTNANISYSSLSFLNGLVDWFRLSMAKGKHYCHLIIN